jgi:hypothetical protein
MSFYSIKHVHDLLQTRFPLGKSKLFIEILKVIILWDRIEFQGK